MFGFGAYTEEPSQTLVITKFYLFYKVFIAQSLRVDPLVWWWAHEGRFPNVAFLAKQILRISR